MMRPQKSKNSSRTGDSLRSTECASTSRARRVRHHRERSAFGKCDRQHSQVNMPRCRRSIEHRYASAEAAEQPSGVRSEWHQPSGCVRREAQAENGERENREDRQARDDRGRTVQ
ncbi:MAG: hypothetical protein ACLRMN_15565 [Mediterraneibacter gnavus]